MTVEELLRLVKELGAREKDWTEFELSRDLSPGAVVEVRVPGELQPREIGELGETFLERYEYWLRNRVLVLRSRLKKAEEALLGVDVEGST